MHHNVRMQKMEHHRCNGLLAGVIVSGGVVLDHFSVLDVYSPTNTIDLRTQYYSKTHLHELRRARVFLRPVFWNPLTFLLISVRWL